MSVKGATVAALCLVTLLSGTLLAEAPDISMLPPHPRIWIGGVKTAPGYIDPAALRARMKTHEKQFAILDKWSDLPSRTLSAVLTGNKEKLAKAIDEMSTRGAKTGNDLVDLALAFDWAASSMPDGQRREIAKHLGDAAESRLGEAGGRFNALDNNALRRDMGIGLVALAIAGDDPRAEKLFKNAYSLFSDFLEETGDNAKADDLLGRAAYGGGWPEGHDYDGHGSRYAMIFFLGVRSATGTDVFSPSKFWRDKQYYHIYAVLPNGINIMSYQDDDHPYVRPKDRDVMLVLSREFKDPHARWYVNHVNMGDSSSGIWEFLFDEPGLAEHDYSDLPLAHYIPGTGLVIARSGWGANDTLVGFCASDWYIYHQNNAQNVFSIYRNAPLAVKDGIYDGEVHEHYVNYTIRTIAYNGVTVYDPKEVFHGPEILYDDANDGGQMIQQWKKNPDGFAMWRQQARRTDGPMRDIVDWKGFETNDKYTYMAAEAGRAYSPGKVPFFSRQLVFIYPNWVIVFDRVTSGDPSFVKKFHLHAPEEISVDGAEAVVTTRTTNHTTIPGRLFVQSLLPAGAQVGKVEGFATYGGKSWTGPKPYDDELLCPSRLEITAPPGEMTYFLTAMYACDATVDKAPKAELTEDTPDKVSVSLDSGQHKLHFAKTGDVTWGMDK